MPSRKLPNRKTPISITRKGKKTSITGSRSTAAQAIRRGRMNKPKASSANAAPKATKKPADLKNYAGDPLKFLGDFFSGGAFRK